MESILSAIVGAIAGAFCVWILDIRKERIETKKDSELREKHEKEAKLAGMETQLNQMLAMAIKYPVVENAELHASWPNDEKFSHEDNVRYDYFCCIFFNLLYSLWCQCEGDKERMYDLFAYEDMLIDRVKWWNQDSTGYNEQFRTLINNQIKEIQERGFPV